MNRQPLLQLLCGYEQRYPQEAVTVGRVRKLVEEHADCFLRTCRPGHITASAWILSTDMRSALLALHGKLGSWLQLGGHADGQYQVHEVALREAEEESGMSRFRFLPSIVQPLPLDIDVHDIPDRYDGQGVLLEDAHEHHDIRFLLVAEPDQELKLSSESRDIKWFTPDELVSQTEEESILRMHRKAQQVVRELQAGQ